MNVLAELWALFDRAQRRRFVVLQGVALLMAMATVAGIASVVPFFAVLGDPSLIGRNFAISWLYRSLGFHDHLAFCIALGLCFLGSVLVTNTINMAGTLAMNRFSHTVGNRFCVDLFREYVDRGLPFHLAQNSSKLLNRVVWETNRGTTNVLQSIFLLGANLMTGLFIMVSLLLADWSIALGALVVIGGGYGSIYLTIRQRLLQSGRLESLHMDERTKIATETFGAIKEITLAGDQEFFRERFEQSCRAVSRSALRIQAFAQTPRYVMESVVVGGLVTIALILMQRQGTAGGWMVKLTFLAFAAYRLLPALQQVFQAVVRIRADRIVFHEMVEDLARAKEGRDRRREARVGAWGGRPRVAIELRDVTFRYANDRPRAIQGVSLTIPAGSTVALVGASGSGKTTLVDLIVGLLVPEAGEIAVDGEVLRDENRAGWRANVAYVPQHVFLLDSSVAENVALAADEGDVDQARVEEALRLARLDDLVRSFPNGMRELVGERGVRLSGGQRQRVGIARALYRDASVLVMDEATNALDGLTESEIMTTLADVREGRTIILIAHRWSSVERCDAVFEITHGEVSRSGSVDEVRLRGSSGQHADPLAVGQRPRPA